MSQLQVTGEAKIRDIQGPVVANSGVITALDGAASQYVRGDGTLADFPTSSGGGSSVSYYLNSSVSQGTIGGVAYRELSKDPIIGAGTDIAISSNGYVANYITDANDPDVVLLPGGNFNCEFYFSVNNNTGNPFTYAELYKYDGTTFTLLGSSVGVPEYINQGTIIAPYYFAIPVATAALALTDRLAIRIYVNVDGRTVTLHTENGHLCQVVTTLSKGMVSLNNLTDQSQFLTTGTAGTNFAIASTGDTHTFNLPVASATNTGKLSSTDWSTFNNKQNALTNPITGLGASGNVAYFDGTTSITSENSFNYDATLNRLGVNTTVPNATIGANANTDSGYSLLLKNDNANYNGIGFATSSTYGNVIGTEKLGTALTMNLTLLNQSGYISLTEAGSLGVNILNPNAGVDIYSSTSSSLCLHTANSGVTSTDGLRLSLFSNSNGVLRNNEGSLSMSSEGDFYVVTLGAENIRVNSANGFVGIGNPTTLTSLLTVNGAITQSSVLSSLLKTNASGTLVAAVAGTDYVVPSALSGYVPTSRTITINGTTQNLSTDISYSVGTIGGSGDSGRVAYYNGTNSITSEAGFIYDSSTNRLGVNTSVPNATIGADAALNSGYGLLIKTGASNYNGIGIAIDSTYGNTIETAKLGTAPARNLTLLNQGGFISVTENGNLGVNILTANTGIDIYNSTQSQLWLHNAATGITATDGVRLALFNNKNANLINFDGGLSLTAEGDFQIITIGAENFRINSANGFVGIGNPTTLPSLLTVNGGATITALTTGQILFPTSGGTLAGSSSLFWDNTNAKLGIGTTTLSTSRVTITSTSEASHLHLVANAPALTFTNALSFTYYAGIGMATASNNFVTGAVQGDLALGAFNTSSILFFNNNTNTIRMSLNGSGAAIFSGSVTARGPKSQIVVDGNSVGAGISLTNTIVGANRRNWGIFTEENVEGDFVIERSTSSGGTPNTAVLSLSRDGNASIGTSSPISFGSTFNNLTTSGSTGSFVLTTNSTNSIIGQVGVDDTLVYYGSRTNHAVTFSTNTIERMRITTAGNVGIGTSAPTDTLHLERNGAGLYNSTRYTNSNSTANFYVGVGGSGVSNGSLQNNAYIYNVGNSATIFATNDTERMRITSGGNVGIGTSSPNFLVQVNKSDGGASVTQYTNADTGSASSNGLLCGIDSGEDGLFFHQGAKALRFGTSDTDRMRITSGGAIGFNGGADVTNVYDKFSMGYFNGNYGWLQTWNSTPLYFNKGGNAVYAGTQRIDNNSDQRIKENIAPIENALNVVLALNGRKFNMLDENGKLRYGFVAQEVQPHLEDFVTESDRTFEKDDIKIENLLTLESSGAAWGALLVEAIKELEARIKQLENK